MNILTANLLFSTLVFWIAAKLYLLPRLPALELRFLAPGATYAGIPMQFAYPAGFGDLAAALLALAAIPAVATNWKRARLLVWIFNVEGTLDLVAAISLATIYGAHAFMGPAYWIPAFWVPALLVTHYITFLVLLNIGNELRQDESKPRCCTIACVIE
jgi:hypothetical protein